MDYEALIDVARPIVRGRGGRAGLGEADLEDLLQIVLTKFVTTWDDDRAPDNVEAWLETATKNAIIDRARAEDRRPAANFAQDDDADPVGLLVHQMRSSRVASLPAVGAVVIDDALALLASRDADVLRRRFIEGRSAAEVAEELGLSPASVDQRVSRAKRKLREALEDRPDLREALEAPHPQPYALEQRPRVRRGGLPRTGV
ncbi:sigma-70 family RNA polymerase sigma factor [Nocardioides sp. Y6]|uniref:Sigma-70 family RNA polymerase sigma factor n=1 Tax=Nocardioides malaquae TaxID=2773426 RepID=A0ABR9RXC4_9ACTN|nr:sigma-70 family RNA polymerase sigma factor [Nocardioides malaquae]MBE7326030.1 sigma-70 family RNA polymerase sigma factor [Nocardioides malaquae]